MRRTCVRRLEHCRVGFWRIAGDAGDAGEAGNGQRKAEGTTRGRCEALTVEKGLVLRTALLRANVSPHNGMANVVNCRGLGTCGTCAVEIDGRVLPAEASLRERLRLSFPPHSRSPHNLERLRLACQVRIDGDLTITKHGGMWGQLVADSTHS